MPVIEQIKAREVLDSRGLPTLEVELVSQQKRGRAIVPAGASTGSFEALELRDGGKRLGGKGVRQAISNILERIAPELQGRDIRSQKVLDDWLRELDGTENKQKLGANAILGVSLAFARLEAALSGKALHEQLAQVYKEVAYDQGETKPMFSGLSRQKMPLPFLNVINGGMHAANNLDIQEFMIVPLGWTSFAERLFAACEVYQALKSRLKQKGLGTALGDEGGFVPDLPTEDEALDLLVESVEQAGFAPGKNFFLALDIAASSFDLRDGLYWLPKRQRRIEGKTLIEMYEKWLRTYPIISIEDPLHEEDWNGWQELTKALGESVQIVGDDLFVTNPERLKHGIEKRCANAVLIKVNQIGTLTETLEVMALASQHGYHTMVSHRSGETEDPFIAHLAVGTGCGQIKSGAPARGERTAKYNELLRIEETLCEAQVSRAPSRTT